MGPATLSSFMYSMRMTLESLQSCASHYKVVILAIPPTDVQWLARWAIHSLSGLVLLVIQYRYGYKCMNMSSIIIHKKNDYLQLLRQIYLIGLKRKNVLGIIVRNVEEISYERANTQLHLPRLWCQFRDVYRNETLQALDHWNSASSRSLINAAYS